MITNQRTYLEKITKTINWGHWFVLFNILCSLILSSRYLFISNWPPSLLGRIYAIISWLGHFSFLNFIIYLLLIFPLTFIITSQQVLRLIYVFCATAGLTLLLIDSEIFRNFHLHISWFLLEIVFDFKQSELSWNWLLILLVVPIIFFIEIIFSHWSWRKLRYLNDQFFWKPVVGVFVAAFLSSHLLYIWSDANFYRPITMQHFNFPLSYPMTARKFLERHGVINAKEYQQYLEKTGQLEAINIEYPLNEITYTDQNNKYNLLLVVINQLPPYVWAKTMPKLMNFARNNLQFSQHYSSGSTLKNGLFGLFYGIWPSYLDNVLASRKPSALISALSQQNYQFGMFSSNGFTSPLYRQALLADFTLPTPKIESDTDTITRWKTWLIQEARHEPWFSYINLNGYFSKSHNGAVEQKYLKETDDQIQTILDTIIQIKKMTHTVIVITTAQNGSYDNIQEQRERSYFSKYQFHTPLVIHWPNMPAKIIDKLTSHEDIMATLMQHLLHVDNRTTDYTQGEDLFTLNRKNNWLVLENDKQLIVLAPKQCLTLNPHKGYYKEKNYKNLKHAHIPSKLLLQVLVDTKRFITN